MAPAWAEAAGMAGEGSPPAAVLPGASRAGWEPTPRGSPPHKGVSVGTRPQIPGSRRSLGTAKSAACTGPLPAPGAGSAPGPWSGATWGQRPRTSAEAKRLGQWRTRRLGRGRGTHLRAEGPGPGLAPAPGSAQPGRRVGRRRPLCNSAKLPAPSLQRPSGRGPPAACPRTLGSARSPPFRAVPQPFPRN